MTNKFKSFYNKCVSKLKRIFSKKEINMNILDQVDELKTKATAVSEGVDSMKSAIEQYGIEEYNKGFKDGREENNSDKLYSQAELEEFLAEAKASFEAKVAELESKSTEMQSQIDAFPGQLDEAKSTAKSELKAELKSKYEEQQVAESDSETGFSDLLK